MNSKQLTLNPQSSTIEARQLTLNPQPAVFFKQPSVWSRALLWGLVSLTTCTIAWASLAKMEKVIPAAGQLEPKGAVKEIQAPVNGVVEGVYVEDGEKVEKGDVLLQFNRTTVEAQIKSLQQIKQSLVGENNFYRQQMKFDEVNFPSNLDLSPEITLLLRNKQIIGRENQLYQALIAGSVDSVLNPEQQARGRVLQADLNSRLLSVEQEIKQFQWQLQQTANQQANARKLLITARNQLATAKHNLATEQGISQDVAPLVEAGAISRIQYSRQQQQEGQIQIEVETHQSSVTSLLGEIESLNQERGRLRSAIAQAQANLTNTIASFHSDLHSKIAANQQLIAEIDSHLGKQIRANDQQIAEIESQIVSGEQNLKYHQLKAPVSGTVFELKAHNGFVAQPTQPLLEIVPDETLIAEVYISSQDRGFVRSGMNVDVRIDSFDFSEFGAIPGMLIWVGADALEPDQQYPYARFPAKIQLSQQFMSINGQPIALESGMAIQVNIKERKRRVISVFSGFLTRQLDSLKGVD